ncbi:MAG TPA: 4Fe-4S binding protein [Tepidisphaeraceae bacterium]|nr:4Fe-4S binding protein [Tepidisphaeraceae bacterium]
MAYVIALPCIGVKDGACLTVCPCDCIRPGREEEAFEQAEQLYIDPDVCVDCDLCAQECPVRAIFPQDDLPAEWRSFVEKNAAFYRK